MTGRQAMLWASMIVPFSELPFLVGLTTGIYAMGALILGIGQLADRDPVCHAPRLGRARALFYGSITYLPLLWLLMALTRT